ncbi:MAG: iron-sulfur cluster assembly accessory protein [Deltaproteobacteria bacterium]|nr:iron-sulfur cluster assembly accessory protein [Deltaproteobacteria bacterium]
MFIGIKRKSKTDAPDVKTVPLPEGKAGAIVLTEAAAKQILEQLSEQNIDAGGLRIAIQGGGCSGLSYDFSICDDVKDNDNVFEAYGAQIFVDPRSLKALEGSILDYETSLARRGYRLKNPLASSTCSCGESFSL